MKMRNWIEWKIMAGLASREVSNYYALPRRSFKVSYIPELAETRRQLMLTDGSSVTLIKDRYGCADKESVTFSRQPDIYWAEHEVAHLYHLNCNASAANSAAIQAALNSPTCDNEILTVSEFFQMLMVPDIAREAVAYGFNARAKTKFFSGFKGSMKITDPPVLDELCRLLREYSCRPQIALAGQNGHVFSLEEERSADAALSLLINGAYQIGKCCGSLLLVEKNSIPGIHPIARRESDGIVFGFGIDYPLVPLPDRQGILRDAFSQDVDSLGLRCLEIHSKLLVPWIREGYRTLADEVERLKP